MTQGKRYKAVAASVDRDKTYSLDEAVKLVKANAKAKFDETIEVAMNLGIDPRHADQMVRGLVGLPNGTGKVLRVGVFVNPDEAQVMEAIAACGLNLLQFHGDEDSAFCTHFGVMSLKAIRVQSAESLQTMANFHTDAFLLDAYSKSGLGGTGEKFNWELAAEAQKFGKPIFLAGGLTPENVVNAVRQVRPFAVDVSSGVESAPGKKDAAKVRAFIAAARAA